MIDDSTIDAKKAKFWCMFSDPEIARLLRQAASHSKKEGENLRKVAVSAVKKEEKLKAKNEEEKIDEVDWNFVQAAHQAAFPMATGNPFQPNFRALDPNSGVPSLQDQQKNNVIAAAASAALCGGAAAAGGWSALCAGICSALGTAGGFLAGIIGAAGSAAASLGAPAVLAIVGGLVQVSTYLYPRIARLVKNISRNGILAQCIFEADGTPYKAVFSLSKKRWELLYANNRWIRKGVNVPKEDIVAFFKSDFFKKFAAACERKMSAVYDDPKSAEALSVLQKMADDKCKKDVKLLIDAEKVVKEYMVKGMFATESIAHSKKKTLQKKTNET